MFRDFVLAHLGGGEGFIGRDCADQPSGHYAGRAWDWLISALDPEEKARADELLLWLLERDAEMFRRAGLRYIIWDRKIWSSGARAWKPYDGFDERGRCTLNACRNPHVDHVHFSFGIDGADGKGSFYDWLRAGMPAAAPPVTPPSTSPLRAWSLGLWVVGFGLGYAGAVRLARERGRPWRRLWS